MFVLTMKTTRFRVWLAGGMAALLLMACWGLSHLPGATPTGGKPDQPTAVLTRLGYRPEPTWSDLREVVIPATFDQEWTAYNKLQQTAGYDLTPYQGQRLRCYTYPVWAGDIPATATLYVAGERVVGGDVVMQGETYGLVAQGEKDGKTG